MPKRGGFRSANKPAKAARTGGGAEEDHRHKADIVKSLTVTLEAAAAEAGVSEEDIVKRATQHLHDNCQAASHVARKTVGSYLRKLREKGNVADEPHTGRPPALTETQLDRACRHFEGGYYVYPVDGGSDREWQGFTSTEHALLENCPNSDKLRRLLKDSGLSVRGFWEAMCRHKGPHGFNKIRVMYGARLDNTIKDERVEVSQDWLAWDQNRLDHSVFLDEKPLWLTGRHDIKVYAPDGWEDIVREGVLDVREKYKIKYLSAVNALLGGVMMEQTSGSHAQETPWMVRTRTPVLTHKANRLMAPLPCCLHNREEVVCILEADADDAVA